MFLLSGLPGVRYVIEN